MTIREEVTELFEANLLLVVEFGMRLTLTGGTIGRVKEEEGVTAGFTISLLIIAAKNGDTLQQFAIGHNGALITDNGILQMIVSAIELTTTIGAIVRIGGFVQENEQGRMTKAIHKEGIQLVSTFIEIGMTLLLIKREKLLLDTL
jgi:hypothetical protein